MNDNSTDNKSELQEVSDTIPIVNSGITDQSESNNILSVTNSLPLKKNEILLKRTTIMIIIFVVLAVVIGCVGVIIRMRSQIESLQRIRSSEKPIVTRPLLTVTNEPSLKTYTSLRYGYSFQYPSDLVIKNLDNSGSKHANEVIFISTDTKYDQNGGWPVNGVQMSVNVTDEQGTPQRATLLPQLLPAKLNSKKIRSITGYTQSGGDGYPYIVTITTNSLPPDYISSPAEVDFVCFSPSGDRCAKILPPMLASFTFL